MMRRARHPKLNANDYELSDRVVHINRVAKVVKGGRRFSFSALVVVGDGNGVVGVGYGKAGEVPEAIRKGVERARKALMRIPLVEGTLPHDVLTKNIGTSNPHNVVRATMTALAELRDPQERRRELART